MIIQTGAKPIGAGKANMTSSLIAATYFFAVCWKPYVINTNTGVISNDKFF